MKICRTCKQGKNLDQFHKRSSSADGLRYECKPCVKEYNAKRYAAKGALIRARVRERAERIGYSNIYQANRAWYENHYKENREKIIERTKAYAKANKEQKRAIKARRRMRETKGMSKLDRTKSILYRKKIKDYPCHYCSQVSAVMHDDHYYPLSKGGTDHWWNLVRACDSCNFRKNAKLASEFNF